MKRVVGILFGGAILFAAPALVAGGLADASCGRAQFFNHSDDGVDYGLLMETPSFERKLLFKGLTPERKSELWQTHLERTLDQETSLTPEQVDVVLNALEFVSRAETFSTHPGDPLWEDLIASELKALELEARAVFSPSQVERLFLGVSGGDRFDGLRAAPLPSPRNDVVDQVAGSANVLPTCSCSTSSDFCGRVEECRSASCQSQSFGCGLFGLYVCNGLCFHL